MIIKLKIMRTPLIYILCLVSISFLIQAQAMAQDISQQTISWHCDQLVEKHSNETVSIAVEIKTITSQTIELKYPNQTLTFSIESVDGIWSDAAQNGSLLYHVRHEGVSPGEITVKRVSGNASIEIDFTLENEYGLHQVFDVSTFNVHEQ
jgi:hypothetical protein